MPRKRIFREDILNAAVGLVREEGPAALSVRNIAKKLGCSTQPVYSEFESMEALREELTASVRERCLREDAGSYKQVAWAEDIRTKAQADVDSWLGSMRAPLQATYTDAEDRIMKVRAAVDGMFQTQTAAKFWIDRRSLDGYGWARLALGLTTD